MTTWQGPERPAFARPTPLQWLRFGTRMTVFVTVTAVLLVVYSLGALIERLTGGRRLTAPCVTLWSRTGAWCCGLHLAVEGTPMRHGGARVANHVSWVDIFTLLATSRMFLVAKSEVRSWPFMGWLAAYTGTHFVERDRRAAKSQEAEFLARIRRGDRLGFFPEGTSTDGMRVLPFKSTLFSAFVSPEVIDDMWVQPVSIVYRAPRDQPAEFYGWWGDTGFLEHFIEVVAKARGGRATVVFHPPVQAKELGDRKSLARHCEAAVREGLERVLAAQRPSARASAATGSSADQ